MRSDKPAAKRTSDRAFTALVVATALSVVVALQVIFLAAPTEATMGVVQKIFYFHVPAAYAMYLGATACLIGSAGYLARGTARWDAVARAGADVAVTMGLMVLISGPLWAAKAWGRYWTWDPRLTTSLLSVMVYVAYVVLRAFTGDGEAERKFAAALGVLGAANLPIIHYSVQKWGGQHPRVFVATGGRGLSDPAMQWAIALGFLTFTLLAIVLVWQRARIHLAAGRLAELEEQAALIGVGGD